VPGRLDPGCHEVALVKDIKRLRNDYVHPKVLHGKWVRASDGHLRVESGGKEYYSVLCIGKEPTVWDLEDAAKVARAITDFYNYFFSGVCGFNDTETCAILINDKRFAIGVQIGNDWGAVDEFKQVKSKYSIKPAFIGAT
jgi:hypothetical protein